MKRIAAALILAFGLVWQAIAQAPPPVPALPDTQRLTQYSISSSTCACAVNFAIFGDSTDVDQWVQVWINGVQYLSTDPSHGWALTSNTGSLGSIARPITDAVLTFTQAQTGTVQIVGARRPRRVSQFAENRGVAARDLNQAITDLVAQNREQWDLVNRALLGPPGEVLAPLPSAAARAGGLLGFDSGGKPIITNTSGLPISPQLANTIFAGPASGATAVPTFRALVPADLPNYIDVFLIAGQSNAVGNGLTPGPTVPPGKVLQVLSDGTIKDANDPIGLGTNMVSTGSAWPQFGITWYNATGRLIAFIPTAVDGSSQEAAADQGTGNWDTTGALFTNSITALNNALTALRAAGYTPIFRGVLWSQGERDAFCINSGIVTGCLSGPSQANYTAAFTSMLARYRAATIGGATYPQMPFYFSRTGTVDNIPQTPPNVDVPGFSQIRAAQDGVAASDPYTFEVFQGAVNFTTAQLGMMRTDGIHYTTAGYNFMGRTMAENIISGNLGGVLQPSPPSGQNYFPWGRSVAIGTSVPDANSIFISSANTNVYATPPNAPLATVFHGIGADSTQTIGLIDTFANASGWSCRRANGTMQAITALADADAVCTIFGFGADNTGAAGVGNYSATAAGRIVMLANGAWTSTNHGLKMEFDVTPNASVTRGAALTLNAPGSVQLNSYGVGVIISDSGGNLTSAACAAGQILAGGSPQTCTATPTLGASGTLGSITFGNATSGLVTLQPVTGALGTVTASLPANTGTIAELNLAQSWTAKQTISGASFTLSGNITAAAWTTSGIRHADVAGTLTDSSSSGAVATMYGSVSGGDTYAASSATTYTNAFSWYFKAPVAGASVTITNGWALGADSVKIGTSNPVTISTAGLATIPGTINVSGTFQSGGNAMTFPGSAATIARTDAAQTFAGVQTFGNGTVGAPSINLGDATSGLYRPAANAVAITTNGVLAGYWNATQQLGVNTAPGVRLDINDNATGTGSTAENINGPVRLTVADTAAGGYTVQAFGGNAVNIFARADGTAGTPTAMASAETIGALSMQPWNGSAYNTLAQIRCQTWEAQTTTTKGTHCDVLTTNKGNNSLTSNLSVLGDGSLAVGAAAVTAGTGTASNGTGSVAMAINTANKGATITLTAPGASVGTLVFGCGTNAGTGALYLGGGTSATFTRIIDNIGAGVTGC